MKYFICSRGRNSLSYEFLKNLNSLGEDIYTDYETLVNNYDTFYQMVSDNTCPLCGNKAIIEGDIDGNVQRVECPACHGKKHFTINLIVTADHEDLLFDDDNFMDHLVIYYVNYPRSFDEYVADECNQMYIKVTDPDGNRGCEYNLTSLNMSDVLGLKLTKEGIR